ncbi:hypothetical protein BCR44DRAFT_1177456 [Catenaria anguillulae PL171]|uniref:Uncharacterized protein n=1 Tax=Catenaria anguillulae PL171 TaxID=765915 RepID=A0A1Y2HHS3_9FUNG|nr:hypothetical protein BCR44DRAFT_1177456 [Catenaria anguillulae PL171]
MQYRNGSADSGEHNMGAASQNGPRAGFGRVALPGEPALGGPSAVGGAAEEIGIGFDGESEEGAEATRVGEVMVDAAGGQGAVIGEKEDWILGLETGCFSGSGSGSAEANQDGRCCRRRRNDRVRADQVRLQQRRWGPTRYLPREGIGKGLNDGHAGWNWIGSWMQTNRME